MGQACHGSGTSMYAVRAATQQSLASFAQLSRELRMNTKAVAKRRRRETVEDTKTGPTESRPMVLSEAAGAMVVAF